eukprot:1320764-Pleurochrysis_carterae.AAC.1
MRWRSVAKDLPQASTTSCMRVKVSAEAEGRGRAPEILSTLSALQSPRSTTRLSTQAGAPPG